MLRVEEISKTFVTKGRTVTALEKVTIEVKEGEFVSLVGPSGCGKTTLLRVMAGLTDANTGTVSLDGVILRGVSPDMAFVFQDINLLPWRSVVQNVEIGLEARRVPKQERRERAMRALDLVDLTELANAAPYTLSGGMQQRVGVARALAVEPKVLLMDEPFGHLDNFTRESLQNEVEILWRKLGMTIVFVTHDVNEAIFLSDRVVLLRPAPGRVVDVMAVDLDRPRSRTNLKAVALHEQIMAGLQIDVAAAK